MAELSGETIEELLWEAGCDVEIHLDKVHDVYSFSTEVGDRLIVVGEVFFEEDENTWYVDTDTITIEAFLYDDKVGEDLTIPDDEDELVYIILRLGGEA